MKLEKAERSQLERIVAISKRAFETDVAVGGAVGDYPPEYDSVIWHEQMLNVGHLFHAIVDDVAMDMGKCNSNYQNWEYHTGICF